ncbi:MAG TPA: DoxX family protein [Bryobacteraceae bacterium]|nr:DoxX family protein [Bryobacteraceae bacterium]
MRKLLALGFLPRCTDCALLTLRLWLGITLFLGHGMEKIRHFSAMAAHFPDPVHIGPVPSLAFALLSDAICSVLAMIGVATRLAALIITVNTGVAFTLVHHMRFSGPGGGELPWVYMGGYLAIVLAGPGRYSVDGK